MHANATDFTPTPLTTSQAAADLGLAPPLDLAAAHLSSAVSGGDDGDDDHPSQPLPRPHPNGQVGPADAERAIVGLPNPPSTASLSWGPDMHQDEKMTTLGIAVHTQLRIVTCVSCKVVIDPANLLAHLSQHLKKTSVSAEYCDELRASYSLIAKDKLTIPGVIIPAIPTLPVFQGLYHCKKCGYAVHDASTLRKHTTCPPLSTSQGHAQSYFPSKRRGFFAVTVPAPPPKPLGLLDIVKRRYPAPLPEARPIALSDDPSQVHPFLLHEGWATVVNGLTGKEIWTAVHDANHNTRTMVAPSVTRFLADVNADLLGPNRHSNRVLIGSYYGSV